MPPPLQELLPATGDSTLRTLPTTPPPPSPPSEDIVATTSKKEGTSGRSGVISQDTTLPGFRLHDRPFSCSFTFLYSSLLKTSDANRSLHFSRSIAQLNTNTISVAKREATNLFLYSFFFFSFSSRCPIHLIPGFDFTTYPIYQKYLFSTFFSSIMVHLWLGKQSLFLSTTSFSSLSCPFNALLFNLLFFSASCNILYAYYPPKNLSMPFFFTSVPLKKITSVPSFNFQCPNKHTHTPKTFALFQKSIPPKTIEINASILIPLHASLTRCLSVCLVASLRLPYLLFNRMANGFITFSYLNGYYYFTELNAE
ncbi:MAG: hypothetical protein J3R72DRAFT_58085 [Linnemannia gamsii]|nr:MAG: hypothetical protein J3R72DRAFT_58085 [Linnemannia gamsii]